MDLVRLIVDVEGLRSAVGIAFCYLRGDDLGGNRGNTRGQEG